MMIDNGYVFSNKEIVGHYLQQKAVELIKMANDYQENGTIKRIQDQEFPVAQLGVKSQYMHRGYYCPSPVLDMIIDNVHRGRILTRPTKKSKPTHRFFFDADNKLRIVETMLPFEPRKEYIVYQDETVYGISFRNDNTLCAISEEIYSDGLLMGYYRVELWREDRIIEISCEHYHYSDRQLQEVEYIYFLPPSELVKITDPYNKLLKYSRYQCVYEGDQLTDVH